MSNALARTLDQSFAAERFAELLASVPPRESRLHLSIEIENVPSTTGRQATVASFPWISASWVGSSSGDWRTSGLPELHQTPRDNMVFARRIRAALVALDQQCLTACPDIRGGKPCLKNSRFSIAQIFSELADGGTLADLAESYELDLERLQTLFRALATMFDQPWYQYAQGAVGSERERAATRRELQ